MAQVRISDLAAELGIAGSTVSRALSGDPRIKEATRERVIALAGKRGYRRDPALSALAERRWRGEARGQSCNLGFLINGSEARRAYRAALWAPFEAAAAERGFSLIPLAVEDAGAWKGIPRKLVAQGIRGVFMADAPRSHLELTESEWASAVWIQVNETAGSQPFHLVQSNAMRASNQALEKIIAAGARRVCFVRGLDSANRTLRRQRAGFLLAQSEHPETVFLELAVEDPKRMAEQLSAFAPDAVLATHWSLAKQIAAMVPRARVDSLGLNQSAPLEMGGMVWDGRVRARAAIDLMEQQLRRGDFGIPKQRQTVLIDPVWREVR